MRRSFLYWMFPLVFLGWQGSTRAQDVVIPAGTLLRCTINEPDFSSTTTEVGDPLICHPNALQEFGRVVSPRGTYMTGHLEAYQDPGHFVGKGWLQLQFDRIGTAEKIEATDEDIEREIAALAERSGESATALRARCSRLTIQGALDRMRPKLRSDKAIEWLYRTAWIETIAKDAEDDK
jgi:hypothetical protein